MLYKVSCVHEGFLNDAFDQRIVWAVEETLQAQIQGAHAEFSSQVLHTWYLKNEVREKRIKMLLAAHQDIVFKIEQCALVSCDDEKQAIVNYAQGFKECLRSCDLWKQEEDAEVDVMLWRFAQSCYTRFGFSSPLQEQPVLHEELTAVIKQAHAKMTRIEQGVMQRAVGEIHQKVLEKRVQRTLRVGDVPEVFAAVPHQTHVTIEDPQYPVAIQEHLISVRKVFKTEHLAENLYLDTTQLSTALDLQGKEMKEKFLKKIDFLLVVVHGPRVWVEAISNEMLCVYTKKLLEENKSKDIQHKAFIIRSDGINYLRGRGALALAEKKEAALMKTEMMQDILIDVALLNGKIRRSQRFQERLHRWPGFIDWWREILKALRIEIEVPLNSLRACLSGQQMEKLEGIKDDSFSGGLLS